MGENVGSCLHCPRKGDQVIGKDQLLINASLSLSNTQTLSDALRVLCEILSPDSEGGPARIPLEQFRSLFSFLAQVDGEISPKQVSAVMEWLGNES